jgi:hypothetical protein
VTTIAPGEAFWTPFNSNSRKHGHTCLPDTRVGALQRISEWVDGKDERRLFWLSGLPGRGKSTIARQFLERERLGANYSFPSGGDVGHAGKFFTSVAMQLANKSPSLNREVIAEWSAITDQSQRGQWRQLISRPLLRLDGNSSPSSFVLIVDLKSPSTGIGYENASSQLHDMKFDDSSELMRWPRAVGLAGLLVSAEGLYVGPGWLATYLVRKDSAEPSADVGSTNLIQDNRPPSDEEALQVQRTSSLRRYSVSKSGKRKNNDHDTGTTPSLQQGCELIETITTPDETKPHHCCKA